MKICNHDIQIMDYWTGWKPGKGERVVNRVCLRCRMHWHGVDGAVREYTRAEWDRVLEEAQ
jgi:cytochrome c5